MRSSDWSSDGCSSDLEIDRIENHRFPRLDFLYWRDGAPPLDSVDDLIEGLELRPARPELRAAPEAIDLAVLKRLAGEADVIARTRGTAQVKRLWSACGLPDFQKLRSEEHTSELQSLMRI